MSRACLQLDVGNSGAKWRLLAGGVVTARGVLQQDDADSRDRLLGCSEQLHDVWVSSVAGAVADRALRDLLYSRWHIQPWFAQAGAAAGGLRNSYAEPGRMGVDRWLAMLGGRQRRTGRFCVVDAGSALTIDLVAADGQHEGGYIIPGPALMERALLLDTGRVRFAEDIPFDLGPGTSTAEAVRHGIAASQAGAVALVMQQQGLHSDALLICGGAGAALQELLEGIGELVPDLVFEGLEVLATESGQQLDES